MGEIWQWEVSKRVVEGDLGGVIALETVRSSGYDAGLVVETFHCPGGDGPLDAEPVEDELPMASEHAGDVLDRLESGAHHSCGPLVEEPAGPVGRDVPPEELKVLLEEVGP